VRTTLHPFAASGHNHIAGNPAAIIDVDTTPTVVAQPKGSGFMASTATAALKSRIDSQDI
jgi:hypothetical protein